jgi:hypothetical protein
MAEEFQIAEGIEGRRKAFADWVASADNPLTTRTIANRLWLWHFGQPIAGNPNNFGSTGKPPTHPELLDFLAANSGGKRLVLQSNAPPHHDQRRLIGGVRHVRG